MLQLRISIYLLPKSYLKYTFRQLKTEENFNFYFHLLLSTKQQLYFTVASNKGQQKVDYIFV